MAKGGSESFFSHGLVLVGEVESVALNYRFALKLLLIFLLWAEQLVILISLLVS